MSEGTHERLLISAILAEPTTQARVAGINQAVVDEYTEAMLAGDHFPRVAVFRNPEGVLRLADGFHRLAAAKAAGRLKVDAIIFEGGQREAWLHAVGANPKNGVRPSAADLRHAVETMLKDPEWSVWSDREIARQTGSSHQTVARIRQELSGPMDQMAGRLVRRGDTTYVQQVDGINGGRGASAEGAQNPESLPIPQATNSDLEDASDDPSESPRHTADEIPFEAPAPSTPGLAWDTTIRRWRMACATCGEQVQVVARVKDGPGALAPHRRNGAWCQGTNTVVVEKMPEPPAGEAADDDDEEDVVQDNGRGDLVLSPKHQGVATPDLLRELVAGRVEPQAAAEQLQRRAAVQQDAAAFVAEEVQPVAEDEPVDVAEVLHRFASGELGKDEAVKLLWGSSRPRKTVRDPLDRYYTRDDVAVSVTRGFVASIFPEEPDMFTVLEPSVGGGAWVRALRDCFPDVTTFGVDIDPDAKGLEICDAHYLMDLAEFAVEAERQAQGSKIFDLVLGNPPFVLAEKHARIALDLVKDGGWVVFLLPLGFLSSGERQDFWERHPLDRLLPLVPRPSFREDGRTAGQEYAIFAWQKGVGSLASSITRHVWRDITDTAPVDDIAGDDILEAAK